MGDVRFMTDEIVGTTGLAKAEDTVTPRKRLKEAG
jgi:hypothetical protein